MPKTPKSKARTVRLAMVLTIDEHRALADAARFAHLPLGTWLRAVGLDAAAKVRK